MFDWLVPTIYRTRGEHASHYATDAVPYFYLIFIYFFNDISTQWLLLAHLDKGNVSFYHHLTPVVRRLSFVVYRPLTIHILIFSSFYILLFDKTAARTHNISHSRRAR
jgi:hypothetical protein